MDRYTTFLTVQQNTTTWGELTLYVSVYYMIIWCIFSLNIYYFPGLFVDLLFTLLSSGKILKASTRTNPCKKIQEWDTKTNPDGKVVNFVSLDNVNSIAFLNRFFSINYYLLFYFFLVFSTEFVYLSLSLWICCWGERLWSFVFGISYYPNKLTT